MVFAPGIRNEPAGADNVDRRFGICHDAAFHDPDAGRDDNPHPRITGGFGLLSLADCRRVAVEVFEGNTAEHGALQLSLFGDRDPAEVPSADSPDERLVVCRSRFLADERARKRRALLAAAEKEPSKVATAVTRQRRPLRGTDRIGLADGAVLNHDKMAKRFTLTVTDDQFAFARNATIRAKSRLDCIYVIPVNVLTA